MFNVVSGLVPPDAGSIRFDGEEIAGWAPDAISRRGLVRTFQVARGFPKLSVFQHLMLYGRDQPGESLWQAIVGTKAAREREAALAERAWETARFLKLDHLIDNPATALSGGQKKLLEIGRALMAEPRLVLLDEPTAGVNPTLQNEIGERLLELPRRGITVLLIEHDMGFIARLCDPVIVMAEGQVLTQGTFDEVRTDHRVREAYLGTAARHEPAADHRPARRLCRGRRDREGRRPRGRRRRDRRPDRPQRRRQVDPAEADRRPAAAERRQRALQGARDRRPRARRRSAGRACPSCRRSATCSAP